MSEKNNPKRDWGFYVTIPRIVRTQYPQLTHVEKWLYICLKDLCGEGGMCYRSLRSLELETSLSTGTLSTGIRHLQEAGLIHAEKKRRSSNPTAKEVWHITVADIWQANGKYHPTEKRSPLEHYQENVHGVNNNVHLLNNNVQIMNGNPEKRSPDEQQCSRDETEVIPIEARTITEEITDSSLVASATETHTQGDAHDDAATHSLVSAHALATGDNQSSARRQEGHPTVGTPASHRTGQLTDTPYLPSPTGEVSQSVTSLVLAEKQHTHRATPAPETMDTVQQTPSSLHLLADAVPPVASPTSGSAVQASKRTAKAKTVTPVATLPLSEPDMSSDTWDDETVVQYAEWCNHRRYAPSSKMRADQLKKAAKLHKEDKALTMKQYKMAHDERYDDWWREHRRALHVSDMAACDNSGVVRVYAMLDRLETKTMQHIQRATLSAALQQPPTAPPDPRAADRERRRQDFYAAAEARKRGLA